VDSVELREHSVSNEVVASIASLAVLHGASLKLCLLEGARYALRYSVPLSMILGVA